MNIFEAAVAVVEWSGPHGSSILLLRRASNPLDPWSGHMAFPGGKKEPSDDDLWATCLRETYEECGLLLHKDHLVGSLPAMHAGRSIAHKVLVQPWHFKINADLAPQLTLQGSEIAGFYWLPVTHFLDTQQHQLRPLAPDYPPLPCLDLGEGAILWGFTYGVLQQLLTPPPTLDCKTPTITRSSMPPQ